MVASTIVPVCDLDPLGLQMHVHRFQHQPAKIVPLQQVTEPQGSSSRPVPERCRGRRRRTAACRRLVQQLLHAGVRQVEPLLHEVRPQHDRQTHRLPSVARLRIVRTHQSLQPRPRNDLLHLIQETAPAGSSDHTSQTPPDSPDSAASSQLTSQTIRLTNQAAVAELVQSLPKGSVVGGLSIAREATPPFRRRCHRKLYRSG